MHKKLKKSPLTYVLAQIKFSEVLTMDQHIPILQKSIRNEFSEYREQRINAINLKNSTSRTIDIWHFLDKSFTTGIIVTTNSITVHTSKYVSFEDMIDEINDTLIKFNKVIENNLYSRIGLRYVNLIHSDINKALQTELLGYHLHDKNVFKNTYLTRSETTQKTSNGIIKVNSMHISDKNILNSNNLYISPDLAQGATFLSFEHHNHREPKKDYIILDIDHFTDVADDFTSKKIAEQLNKLHEGSFIAFKKAITKETWEKWK